jgi:large subunit ribosomal protein L25
MAVKAEQMELLAEERTALGSRVKKLREDGWVPAIMYGRGFDPVALQLEELALQQVLSRVGGSQLVRVSVKGSDSPEMVLVREVQRDPLRGSVLHVDLYRVMMTEKLTTEVPLTLVGQSPMSQVSDAVVITGISRVEVQCLPGDLVDAIEVDLSALVEFDQSLLVGELPVPDGIEILTDPDEMIARVVQVRMAVPEPEVEVEELAIEEEIEGVVEEIVEEADIDEA